MMKGRLAMFGSRALYVFFRNIASGDGRYSTRGL